MARRVTATFTDRDAANRAVAALTDMGAQRDHISTLIRGEHDGAAAVHEHTDDLIEPAREVGDSGAALTTSDEGDAAQGAATGAAIGAVAGLTAGLLSLMVPGFGLVTAGGALAWALGGAAGTAAAGAVAGGVYGSLRDIGIEDTHARHYEERVRGGDVLLTASLPLMEEDRVRAVLEEHGAEHVTFTEDLSSWSSATANVARGEAKQVEGEIRDRAADRTLNPMDDLAAKTQKAEGKLQEELGEEEETVEPRRY
jgi:uncharacterized protein YjbJ (UPF0337 family)